MLRIHVFSSLNFVPGNVLYFTRPYRSDINFHFQVESIHSWFNFAFSKSLTFHPVFFSICWNFSDVLSLDSSVVLFCFFFFFFTGNNNSKNTQNIKKMMLLNKVFLLVWALLLATVILAGEEEEEHSLRVLEYESDPVSSAKAKHNHTEVCLAERQKCVGCYLDNHCVHLGRCCGKMQCVGKRYLYHCRKF